jgi:hypothetical protein
LLLDFSAVIAAPFLDGRFLSIQVGSRLGPNNICARDHAIGFGIAAGRSHLEILLPITLSLNWNKPNRNRISMAQGNLIFCPVSDLDPGETNLFWFLTN